jgi:hypothetical protein
VCVEVSKGLKLGRAYTVVVVARHSDGQVTVHTLDHPIKSGTTLLLPLSLAPAASAADAEPVPGE